MRWPLQRQIMLPMAAIMLVTVLSLGGVAAVLAVRATMARIEGQIAGVTRILQESNFPLTAPVLRQLKALSGAELLVVDEFGRPLATSGEAWPFMPRLAAARRSDQPRATIALGDRLWTRHGGFFHTAMPLSGRRTADAAATLHIFYPQREYRRAWQHAIYPSLAFIALALPAVMLLAGLTAARIGKRVGRLQEQVDRIAQGDFQQLALADGDDEIRALGQAVNRMAAMLADYEQDVRRTERTRTLARLGGGIAHQLRNSATGCRMALDLHADEFPAAAQSECLGVAKTQLRLMDEYVERFLRLGDPSHDRPQSAVDLTALVDELLPLVRPAARHAGVSIVWQPPADPRTIVGDASTLTQLLINLLINAIEAAAQSNLQSQTAGRVVVELTQPAPGRLWFAVSDTGPGPADEVRDQLFEPFVSSKRDGVGIGLAVACDVAQAHGGALAWDRIGGMTRFAVEFPAASAAQIAAVANAHDAVESRPSKLEMQCV
jgi:signal transduction histidine kinase